jgi:O-antigen ligase
MKLYKIIDKIILFLVQALVFLVPLYFAFLYKDYSVFTIDKTAVFQIFVELILFLSVLKFYLCHFVVKRSVAKKSLRHESRNDLVEQKNLNRRDLSLSFEMTKNMSGMIIWIVSLFFLAFTISTIFSIDPSQSFWGSFFRKQGLIMHIHYFVFFLLLLFNLAPSRERSVGYVKKINKIISAILFGSFFVSILGILQWLGYDPLPWQERIPLFGRITSTMGQPIFLANYLLFVIPLTVYRIYDLRFKIQDLKIKKKSQSDSFNSPFEGSAMVAVGVVTTKQKLINNTKLIRLTLYIVLLALQLSTLLFTYTRGAIIGLVFGILFFFVAYPLVIKKNKKAFFKSILLFLLSIFLIIFFIMVTRSDENYANRLYWRMKNIVDLEHGSTALRVKYWTSAFDAIRKKPILGYGPENQQGVLVEYHDNTWIPYEKIGLVPDRAHNEYLDIAISGGLVLLLSYLLMLFYVFYVGLKTIYYGKDKQKQILLILILSSLFSYSVSLFFAFSVVEISTFFYLFIALVLILSNSKFLCHSERSEESREERNASGCSYELKSFHKRLLIYTSIPVAAFLMSTIVQNINMVRADYHFYEARSGFVDRQYLKMYENYIKTFELNGKEKYYKESFINDTMMSMFQVDSPEYKKAITNYVKDILNEYEGTTFYQIKTRAKIYSLLGKFDDSKYLDMAEVEYEKAISRSKFLPSVWMGLAQVYIEKEEYDRAIETFEHILSFLPKLDSRQLNRDHRQEVKKLMTSINKEIEYCNKKLVQD